MQVTKRDGSHEPLNIERFHKVITWACEDIEGVSVSEIALKSQIQFYDKIKTTNIQETLIKAASELINEETPNYQYVAGRLINYHIRKEVYKQYTPVDLFTHYSKIEQLGFYDSELKDLYTQDEFKIINGFIDHNRDNLLTYAAMEQFRGKYLVKNRTTGSIYETPQMAFILIAMTLFAKYESKIRLKYVKQYYDAISLFDISLPTPIMAGVRTPSRQYASCVLIETDDSLDSINATSSAIIKYISQKAGIGIGSGSIRALGSSIRNGSATHTGVIPFYKHFQTAVKSCSQGALRGGSATLNYPIWHLEVEDLLVLKNNKGIEENRIRHLDYVVQFNKTMYERLLSNGNITLFSPSDVPGLYEAFFANTEKFNQLYEKYERSTKIRKKVVPAIDLFSSFIQERKDTGRIYLMNVDHCNTHGSFVEENATIKMTNLCTEVTLVTKPLNDIKDEEGMIATCILSAINWGKIKQPSDFEIPCKLAVRALDALIDYQDYPVKAAEIATKKYRPLGVGIINLAYWLALNGMNYTNPDLGKIHEYTEAWSYYLIKASADLAIEKGCLPESNNVKYCSGILPIDTYKKDVDNLVSPQYKMDWDALRLQLSQTGIRNATLMALMPAESSALVSNSTNGIEPVRALITSKQSKEGTLKQVVPSIKKLKNKYELLWDQKNPKGYLQICAVLQKFIDQAISVNTSYNPKYYPDEKVPLSEMIGDILNFYKYGGKNLYYCNTADGQGEIEIQGGIQSDEICESCAI